MASRKGLIDKATGEVITSRHGTLYSYPSTQVGNKFIDGNERITQVRALDSKNESDKRD